MNRIDRLIRTKFLISSLFILICIVSSYHGMAATYDTTVEQAQQWLKELGYDPGTIDGYWGKKTELAVRKFQQDNDLPISGKLNDETLEKLKMLAAPTRNQDQSSEMPASMPKQSPPFVVLDLEIFKEPILEMEFVQIPAGCFEMGEPEQVAAMRKRKFDNRRPVHKVCVDEFWMGKYEVTNAQYRRFRGDHDSGIYKGVYGKHEGLSLNEDNQPVSEISWEDAQALADWLTSQHNGKYTFRLPTEAEWEYAARGGTTSIRYWGDDSANACLYENVEDQTYAKEFPDESSDEPHECDDGYVVPAPVGSFQANPFGLYDVLGNVIEWCQDFYGLEYYKESPPNNPQGPVIGTNFKMEGGMVKPVEGNFRVLRGASFFSHPDRCGCAVRSVGESDQSGSAGVRLVRE